MKYVRCDGHCKYPAYDKEEIDNLLKDKANSVDVYTKTNVAVVDTTTTIRTSENNGAYSGTIMKNMPEGFTPDNCVVISKMFGADTPSSSDTLTDSITVSFLSYDVDGVTYNQINGSLNTSDSSKAGTTQHVRIVLMKI